VQTPHDSTDEHFSMLFNLCAHEKNTEEMANLPLPRDV